MNEVQANEYQRRVIELMRKKGGVLDDESRAAFVEECILEAESKADEPLSDEDKREIGDAMNDLLGRDVFQTTLMTVKKRIELSLRGLPDAVESLTALAQLSEPKRQVFFIGRVVSQLQSAINILRQLEQPLDELMKNGKFELPTEDGE